MIFQREVQRFPSREGPGQLDIEQAIGVRGRQRGAVAGARAIDRETGIQGEQQPIQPMIRRGLQLDLQLDGQVLARIDAYGPGERLEIRERVFRPGGVGGRPSLGAGQGVAALSCRARERCHSNDCETQGNGGGQAAPTTIQAGMNDRRDP